MNRPTHFEIHAGDPDRAARFYAAVFDWRFRRWDGPEEYWLVTTGDGPGINGGMVRRRGAAPVDGQPVNAYPLTIKVASCDDTMAAILASGGSVALPKGALPGMGWLAFAKDPEGNIFGVMQDDRSAA